MLNKKGRIKAMKIELIDGCIADSFNVDGKELINMSEDKLKKVFKKSIDKILGKKDFTDGDKYGLIEVMKSIMMNFYDDFEVSGEPCECCGDYVETYSMEV